jgi:two-component system nitrogen regulation sensor histidine kinase NtrY
MVYRNFYIHVIIRVSFIFFTSLWLAYEIANPPFVYTILFLGSILLIQTYGLIWYVNRTNRELSRFFTSLRDKDSSFSIVGREKGGSFRELAETLNETAALLKEARIEKESQYLYLRCIVEHVTIGLISFSANGKVSLINNAAKKLLGIKSIVRLDQLNSIMEGFDRILNEMNPGEQTVLRMTINNELLQVLIRVTGFKFHNEQLKLVSLQDFRQELEEQEIKSWQKLIRVMTHEIMNSVTPITTLTLAIKRCLTKDEEIRRSETLDDENIRDAVINASLIEERSKGLTDFVNNYRSISRIEKLELTHVIIAKLLRSTASLFKEELAKSTIRIDQRIVPEDLTFPMDEKLIQQVLINLVKNSIEALCGTGNGNIELHAYREVDGTPVIGVSDNGAGIPREILDDIFVPFFTTKKNGSGIGLSFSRQVMRLHRGTIHVASDPGKGTTFFLKF